MIYFELTVFLSLLLFSSNGILKFISSDKFFLNFNLGIFSSLLFSSSSNSGSNMLLSLLFLFSSYLFKCAVFWLFIELKRFNLSKDSKVLCFKIEFLFPISFIILNRDEFEF